MVLTKAMKVSIAPFLLSTVSALVSFAPRYQNGFPGFDSLNDLFKIVEDPSERGATVLEVPVSQNGVEMYIAIDSDSYGHRERPGNGGIRLLNYESSKSAIDDAVRLAKGMTRKHDMFRTGFSGAKVVVNSDNKDLSVIKRRGLMEDAANALCALDGGMYTGCE